MRNRLQSDDPNRVVEERSALNLDHVATLGKWGIVSLRGVLHHTGVMWNALANIDELIAEKGLLVLAIYNDQDRMSAA